MASMTLQQFTLVSTAILPGEVFKAIATAIPSGMIQQAIEQTKTCERRTRLLPTHLVVCLIIALSFWSREAVKDVLKNMLAGLGQTHLSLGKRWHIPTRAALSKARQRIGPRVMSTLFHLLVYPGAECC
jgi:hypothetical protein